MLKLLRQADVLLRVAAVIAVAYLFYVFVARHTTQKRFVESSDVAATRKFDNTYGGSDLRILSFYPRETILYEGKSTLICYGVMNAKSVTITPPIPNVYAAFNRCVDAAPQHDTTYVLTAQGDNGKTATASFTLEVRADPDSLPHITSFGIARHIVEKGRNIYVVAFAFQNGKDVSIDPPVFSPIEDSAPFGQFYVEPEKTTTYTLTVTGAFGHKAEKKLTIEVK